MGSVSVKLNAAGIRELCLSSEMKTALKGQADKLAANANTDAYSRVEHLHIRGNTFERAPYDAQVKGGRGTAVAFAGTSTYVGAMNEAKNKSLMNQLHG